MSRSLESSGGNVGGSQVGVGVITRGGPTGIVEGIRARIDEREVRKDIAEMVSTIQAMEVFQGVSASAGALVAEVLYTNPLAKSDLRSSILESAALFSLRNYADNIIGRQLGKGEIIRDKADPLFPTTIYPKQGAVSAGNYLRAFDNHSLSPTFEKAVVQVKRTLVANPEELTPDMLEAAYKRVDGFARHLTGLMVSRLEKEIAIHLSDTALGEQMRKAKAFDNESFARTVRQVTSLIRRESDDILTELQHTDLPDIAERAVLSDDRGKTLGRLVYALVHDYVIQDRPARNYEEKEVIRRAKANVVRHERAQISRMEINPVLAMALNEIDLDDARAYVDRYTQPESYKAQPGLRMVLELARASSAFADQIVMSGKSVSDRVSNYIATHFDLRSPTGRENLLSLGIGAGVLLSPLVGTVIGGKDTVGSQGKNSNSPSGSGDHSGINVSHFPINHVSISGDIQASHVINSTLGATSPQASVDQISARTLGMIVIDVAVGCTLFGCVRVGPQPPGGGSGLDHPIPPLNPNSPKVEPTPNPGRVDPSVAVFNPTTNTFETMTPQAQQARNNALIDVLNYLRTLPAFQDRSVLMANPINPSNINQILGSDNLGIPILAFAVGSQSSPAITFIISDSHERMSNPPALTSSGLYKVDVKGDLIIRTAETSSSGNISRISTYTIPQPDFAVSNIIFNSKTNQLEYYDGSGNIRSKIPLSLPSTDFPFNRASVNFGSNNIEFYGDRDGQTNVLLATYGLGGENAGKFVIIAPPTPTVAPTATPLPPTVAPQPTETPPPPTVTPTRVNVEAPNYPVLAQSTLEKLDSNLFPEWAPKRDGGDFITGDTGYGKGLLGYFDRTKPPYKAEYNALARKGGTAFYPWKEKGINGPSIVEVTALIDPVTLNGLEPSGKANNAWFVFFGIYGMDPRDNTKAVATAVVNLEPLPDGKYGAVLHGVKLDLSTTNMTRVPNAPEVIVDGKAEYGYRIYTSPEGMIYLFQAPVDKNGNAGSYELVEYGPMDKSHQNVTLRGGWIGAYGTDKLANAKVFMRNLKISIPQ